MSAEEIKSALIAQARLRGFDAIGVTRPEAVPEAKARLEQFIADGAHGDMIWLATTAERRGSPLTLWPDVRSVIMLGMNYGPDEDPLTILQQRDRAAISRAPSVVSSKPSTRAPRSTIESSSSGV